METENYNLKSFNRFVIGTFVVWTLAIGVSFAWNFYQIDAQTKNLALKEAFANFNKDQGFRDFGWSVLYMKSASRWIDPYIGAGFEIDSETITRDSVLIGKEKEREMSATRLLNAPFRPLLRLRSAPAPA